MEPTTASTPALLQLPGHLVCPQGRELYARTLIRGATDFIFGMNAQAWFENCDIEVVGKGYVTEGVRASQPFLAYLGRPWRPYSRVVFQNSELSDVVHPEGWKLWNNDTNTANTTTRSSITAGLVLLSTARPFSGQLNEAVNISNIFGENYKSEWWVDPTTCNGGWLNQHTINTTSSCHKKC
ncbi:Pectinesterase, Asp active site [Phytophthora cactorum]|nr:Pectinesterase, Asp active site [Phytophthora cactorum]